MLLLSTCWRVLIGEVIYYYINCLRPVLLVKGSGDSFKYKIDCFEYSGNDSYLCLVRYYQTASVITVLGEKFSEPRPVSITEASRYVGFKNTAVSVI
jgi:hypothetical protein